jgi:hypothetical protein
VAFFGFIASKHKKQEFEVQFCKAGTLGLGELGPDIVLHIQASRHRIHFFNTAIHPFIENDTIKINLL